MPEEQRHGKRGMRMRPGWIEVHVNRKRTGPPDGNGGKQSPKSAGILAGHAKRQKQAEKSTQRGAEGHGHAIRFGQSVGGNLRTGGARQEHASMGDQKKGSPENGGTHGEVIFQVAGGRAKDVFGLAVFIEARFAKAGVGSDVVALKIEAVFDQGGAHEGVIADAVAADPRIQQYERQKKQKEERAFLAAAAERKQRGKRMMFQDGRHTGKGFYAVAAGSDSDAPLGLQGPKECHGRPPTSRKKLSGRGT